MNHTKKEQKTKRTRRRNNKRGGSRIRKAYDSATKYLSESKLGQSLKKGLVKCIMNIQINEGERQKRLQMQHKTTQNEAEAAAINAEKTIDQVVDVMECGNNPRNIEKFRKQAYDFVTDLIYNKGYTPERALMFAELQYPGCTHLGKGIAFNKDYAFRDWDYVAEPFRK